MTDTDVLHTELLDPTPVDDLESWHCGYDPAATARLEELLDQLLPLDPPAVTR